jgi:hypothetical protein
MSSIRKKSSITFDVNSDSHEEQLAHPFVHRAMASSNAPKKRIGSLVRGPNDIVSFRSNVMRIILEELIANRP